MTGDAQKQKWLTVSLVEANYARLKNAQEVQGFLREHGLDARILLAIKIPEAQHADYEPARQAWLKELERRKKEAQAS